MTIPEIKSSLPLLTVLAHYGLEVGTGNSMKCPFHSDKKASMKIYPDTNTACCFAGICELKSVPVIDFIMHMDGSDKRAAILKAKELIGQPLSLPATKSATMPTAPATETLDVVAILNTAQEAIK